MAVITPQTDLYLLKVPLEINDINQLTFNNATAQYNYFHSLPHLSVHDFTYQRKDNTIRYGANYDSLISYNYVMYRNDAYSNKWFYAFIDGMEYLNDNVTAISIKTDVWQTWQFDLAFKRTFVEREHTNNDTIGSNLIPENLELGEYVLNGSFNKSNTLNFGGTLRYVVNSTYKPYSDTKYEGTNVYGIPIGGALFVFDYWTQMINAIDDYATRGRLESISQVYVVPYVSFNDDDLEFNGNDDEHAFWFFNGGTTPPTVSATISRPSSLNNYSPRNKKLLTAPFQNFIITNNNGSSNTLSYEYFSNPSSITISGKIIPCVGASSMAYPKNYKGIENNYNESIMGGKFPALSWSGDTYTNWLTQNAVNISTGIISDVAGAELSALGAHYLNYSAEGKKIGELSAGTGLFSNIANTVSEIYKHSLVSQSIQGNTNGGDIVTANKNNSIYIYQYCITEQFAQIIDRYFDMFGYQTNNVKVPNITGRRNWNYVKTIGCYIEADIPQEDLAEIKSMFDKGITLWHNPSTFADYSQANDIIS